MIHECHLIEEMMARVGSLGDECYKKDGTIVL